uniref:Solute carrier family 35 member C2 n=2 Tax=Lygus hesperus TaxID=30085 RepID=A0A146L524_LYGHE
MARVVLQDSSSDWSFLQSGRRGFMWTIIYTSGIIFLYFPLSIGLTFYQRWFLQKFNYPLTVTMCHMAIKFCVAAFCQWLWKCWHGKQPARLDWSTTFRRIIPMGIVSGIDIAFSNWGLHYITVSLYTMTKSSSIVFILLFAILFKLEEMSWMLVGIVLAIAGGLLMFTYQAAQFNAIGFILVLLASFSSGIRWTLAQFLMQKSDLHLKNPLYFLYQVQPWMCLSVVPFVIAFEAKPGWGAWHSLTFPQDSGLVWSNALYVALGSFIALMMELSEYLIIGQLSGLTLSVAGIFKEVCTLTLAIEWTGDIMSRLNFEGLLLCMGGIVLHVVHKTFNSGRTGGHSNHKQIVDEASARFLADVETTTDDDDDDNRDDSSTEVLFSVLQSRDR